MPVEIPIFDVVVLVLLIWGVVFGALRGLVWQLAWLMALVGSALVAFRWSTVLAPVFGSSEPWNRFLAMFVLFIACGLVVWLCFQALARTIERLKLRDFDRQMGALFGLLKSLVICLLLTFFGVTLSATTRGCVLRSNSGRVLAQLIVQLRPALPEEIRSAVETHLEEFTERLKEEFPGPNSPSESENRSQPH